MSKKRLILRVVLGLCAAVAVARLSVSLFPLHATAPAPVIAQDGPVQVEGGTTLLHGGRIEYPEAARKQRIEGDVVAEITLDERGQVTDARIISGPEQLRKAVLSSVLSWHYDPSKDARRVATVTIRFRLPADDAATREVEFKTYLDRAAAENKLTAELVSRKIYEAEQGRTASELEVMLKRRVEELELLRSGQAGLRVLTSEREDQLKRQIEELKHATVLTGKFVVVDDAHVAGGVPGGVAGGIEGGVFGGIKAEGISNASRDAVLSRLPIRVGGPFNKTTLRQVRETLAGIDEHMRVHVKRDGDGKYWLIINVED